MKKLIFLIGIFCVILLRIFYLNIYDNEKYQKMLVEKTENYVYGSNPPRGRILDRNGKILVDNKGIKSLYYSKIKGITIDKEIEIAEMLANILDVNISHNENILKKYDLKEYDDFEFLSKSEGRLPTDRLEFINPINVSQRSFNRDFYIAGVSHGCFCNKEVCEYTKNIEIGNALNLVREEQNKFDKYAVRIDYKCKKLGYVPKYYSEAVSTLIKQNKKIKCVVIQIKSGTVDCRECIKARLIVE